uniref:Endo-1,4-beta-glucanase n=1 Tax=Epidinium caudatum TaxID=47887 RepID=Q9XXV3_9CILI|nr:endo-1,4-beta-glucanase [Epidinium caudatum]
MGEMGFGWNLGNSFDAHNGNGNEGLNSETSWGNPKVSNGMIDKLVAKGFKTIRIPVTWHNHLIDQSYTIDPEWMKRVKTVVDYCIKKGLFVILNVHHDNSNYGVSYGKGYYPRTNQMDESKRFLANVWSQIALAFNNGYDHHLIFELLNEPRLIGDSHEWWYQPGDSSSEECIKVINEYNYLIHYIIRNTGGNNKLRFLLVTNGAASYDYVTSSGFYLPDDTPYNPKHKRILVSVHMYTPYDFAMNGDMSKNYFTQEYKNELESKLNTLKNKFINNGYYVVITEMGATDKMNTDQRIAWGTYYVKKAKSLKMVCVVWDNNIFNTNWDANEKFGLFHRSAGTFEPDSYVNALINAAK